MIPMHHGNPRSGIWQHLQSLAWEWEWTWSSWEWPKHEGRSHVAQPSPHGSSRSWLTVFPTPSVGALACSASWMHSTHHFSTGYPYQSSSHFSLISHCGPFTLQAFQSYQNSFPPHPPPPSSLWSHYSCFMEEEREIWDLTTIKWWRWDPASSPNGSSMPTHPASQS
jgi:hypothetical protein